MSHSYISGIEQLTSAPEGVRSAVDLFTTKHDLSTQLARRMNHSALADGFDQDTSRLVIHMYTQGMLAVAHYTDPNSVRRGTFAMVQLMGDALAMPLDPQMFTVVKALYWDGRDLGWALPHQGYSMVLSSTLHTATHHYSASEEIMGKVVEANKRLVRSGDPVAYMTALDDIAGATIVPHYWNALSRTYRSEERSLGEFAAAHAYQVLTLAKACVDMVDPLSAETRGRTSLRVVDIVNELSSPMGR